MAVVDSSDPAVEQTHISILFLIGDRVLKLKKAIEFPFLDCREREIREAMCHREVELNRRLSPDVYLGVLDVMDDGVAVDHLVNMRRMPEDRRLSRLVRQRAQAAVAGISDRLDLPAQLDALALLIAEFHRDAHRSGAINAAVQRDSVLTNWNDNLATLRAAAGRLLDATTVARVDHLAHRYLMGRGPLLRDRAATGHGVDGHGDLLADDIYLLDDGPRVLDCLEFSDRLRSVDVVDDVAFLAMDLEHLGASDLAERFVDRYFRASGETAPDSLVHHYIAYRAGVRSKVACLRSEQSPAGSSTATRAATEAQELLDLAEAHLRRGRVRMVLVGGLPGTGKTTLAAELSARTGWPVLHSDVIRKRLHGATPEESMAAPFDQGIYRPEHTAATYQALLAEAHELISHGNSVILDASWTQTVHRTAAAQLGEQTSTDLLALQCQAPSEVAAARLIERADRGGSDADPQIAALLGERIAPWPEAVAIHTTGEVAESVASAVAAVQD
jgi:aminoglycoside phosphotransferase family enzyme/predicted kinase